MSYPVTTLGVTPITCKASASVSFTRGLRGVNVGVADGVPTYDLAGIDQIGGVFCDTQTDAAAGYFLGASAQESTNVPAVASEAVTAGQIAYTAASGLCSVTSTNAVRVGIWRTTTASAAVGIIQRP